MCFFTKIKPFGYSKIEIFGLNSEHELQAYLQSGKHDCSNY